MFSLCFQGEIYVDQLILDHIVLLIEIFLGFYSSIAARLYQNRGNHWLRRILLHTDAPIPRSDALMISLHSSKLLTL